MGFDNGVLPGVDVRCGLFRILLIGVRGLYQVLKLKVRFSCGFLGSSWSLELTVDALAIGFFFKVTVLIILFVERPLPIEKSYDYEQIYSSYN